MPSPLPRRKTGSLSTSGLRAATNPRTVLAALALGAASLALYGCPGNLDPSLLSGTGGTGGGAGSGAICDAPMMVLASTDAQKGCGDNVACHGPGIKQGGLDLVSAGVISRLLDKAPDPTKSVACQSSTKPYLISNTNPAQGLLLDKLSSGSCGSPMPYPLGNLPQQQRDCLTQWANAVTTGMITQ
jgi:hypothetical protein